MADFLSAVSLSCSARSSSLHLILPLLHLISHDWHCSVLFTMHLPPSVAVTVCFCTGSRRGMNGAAAEQPRGVCCEAVFENYGAFSSEFVTICLHGDELQLILESRVHYLCLYSLLNLDGSLCLSFIALKSLFSCFYSSFLDIVSIISSPHRAHCPHELV